MFENIESTLFDHGACVGSCKRSLKTVNLPLETSSDSEHLQLPFLWERLVPYPLPRNSVLHMASCKYPMSISTNSIAKTITGSLNIE